MKPESINGIFKSKNNFDYSEEVVSSSKHHIKHQPGLRATAERTLDSEIRISVILPYDGELKISNPSRRKSVVLLSKKINKGFFITTIPVSIHDELNKLNFSLKGNKKTENISVEVIRQEFQN